MSAKQMCIIVQCFLMHFRKENGECWLLLHTESEPQTRSSLACAGAKYEMKVSCLLRCYNIILDVKTHL